MDNEFWGKDAMWESSDLVQRKTMVSGRGWRMPVYQVSNWDLDLGLSPALSSPEAEVGQLLIQKGDAKGGRGWLIFS